VSACEGAHALAQQGLCGGTPRGSTLTPPPVFRFYTNTESGKVDDLESHPEVNISYVGKDGQSWASVSGRAKINTDRGAVKKHWSSALKAWFGAWCACVRRAASADPLLQTTRRTASTPATRTTRVSRSSTCTRPRSACTT
jgi:pyridoxine/pyridoxamine 5'-phosphate oxidase